MEKRGLGIRDWGLVGWSSRVLYLTFVGDHKDRPYKCLSFVSFVHFVAKLAAHLF